VPAVLHLSAYSKPLRVLWLGFAFFLFFGNASAQTLYWDLNGATAGAGTTPSGTWSTSSNTWTSSSAGTSGTIVAWTSGRDAVFSAGTNATGSYTVTISGTQNVSGITVEEGTANFTGGQINFSDATPTLTVNSGAMLNWGMTGLSSSTNTINIGGAGTVNLGLSGTFAGTLNLSGGTLRLTDANLGVDTLNITGNSTIDFAGSASTLNLTNFSIRRRRHLDHSELGRRHRFFLHRQLDGRDLQHHGKLPDEPDHL